MHIENLSNRGMECQYFMRRQKLPLASELGQGKLEAVPAEGMYLLDEYRRQALGINSPLGKANYSIYLDGYQIIGRGVGKLERILMSARILCK